MNNSPEILDIHNSQKEYLGNDKPVNQIEPVVSIYVTTYQHANYISQCLEGILMQRTKFPLEIVIGEDQSTDGTREICTEYAARYPDRIRLYLRDRRQTAQTDSNGNFIKSINGILTSLSCRAKYIAMCEGDDYWIDPDKLQKQVDFFSSHPGFTICFHPAQVIFESGMKPDYVSIPELRQNVFNFSMLLKENFIRTCTVMYRIDPNFSIPSWFMKVRLGDWPMNLLMASRGKIGFLNEAMSVYRVHQGGYWRSKPRSEVIIHIMEMYRLLDSHFLGRYHGQIKKHIGTYQYMLGDQLLQDRKWQQARCLAISSLIACRSFSFITWKNRFFLLIKSIIHRS